MRGSSYSKGIRCPHCAASMRVRNSFMFSPLLKELHFQCNNMDCGATYGGQLVITHGISPSLIARSDIHLRMEPPRLRTDNDNLRGGVMPALNAAGDGVTGNQCGPPADNDAQAVAPAAARRTS